MILVEDQKPNVGGSIEF